MIPSQKLPPSPRTSPCAPSASSPPPRTWSSCSLARRARGRAAGDGRGARPRRLRLGAGLRPRARPRDAPRRGARAGPHGDDPRRRAHPLASVAGALPPHVGAPLPVGAARRRRCSGRGRHEAGHVGDIRNGGLMWCVAYGLVPNVRAGRRPPLRLGHGPPGRPRRGLGGQGRSGRPRRARELRARRRGHAPRARARAPNAETLRAGGDPAASSQTSRRCAPSGGRG